MAPSSYPLLHQLLEEQAIKTPTNLAIDCHLYGGRMTYCEFNECSNRLARYLKDHQPQDREVVGLCLEKGHVLAIAILAVLKAGLAWVPLPMDAPRARIAQIIKACDIELVLCSESTKHVVGDLIRCVVKPDYIFSTPQFRAYSARNLACDRKPTDLCHVLFTSGSTGVPKGVMLEHRAVMHNVRELVAIFELGPETRTLQFAAPTFDVFGLDLFMTIFCGGCLVMAPLSTMIADMTTFIREARITYAQLTPTIIEMIDPLESPNLLVLASSGEALPQSLANRWRKEVRLFNAYGPTETIVCTIQELGQNQVDAACIGRAISGLEVCLLADGGVDEVGEGKIGEICVAGLQLFRGYISTERNLNTIACYRNGIQYYRTGDLGRVEYCPGTGEKTIRYLGRKDNQVKIHGIRVDLGDVENSIMSCPDIKNCAIVLPKSGPSAGRLCSIIVSHKSCQSQDQDMYTGTQDNQILSAKCLLTVLPAFQEVLSVLRAAKDAAVTRLPTHALPTSWWVVEELPLTSSGKIDRIKLRTWLEIMDTETYTQHLEEFSDVSAGEPQDRTSSSNNSEMEIKLQSLWAKVLSRPISVIDVAVSFIQFGADSLDLIRLVSKARNAGLVITLPQIYTTRTIQDLAQDLEKQPVDQKRINQGDVASVYRPFSSLPPARPLAPIMQNAATTCQVGIEEIEDIYYCTRYQAGLMSLDLRHPGSYVCAFSWTLAKSLDINRFRTAWDFIIAQEPVLRNRLIWDATEQDFWQVTIRHQKLNWDEEYFEAPMAIGKNLCRGYVRWNDQVQRWKFHLKIHHSIVDGWSLRLMLNKLKAVYFDGASTSSSGVLFAQFIHFCNQENDRVSLDSIKFWSHYLEGFSQSDFPPSPADPYQEVHATEHQSLQVPICLLEVATRYGVTPAIILYAAVALVVGAHSDTNDVVFGLILAGREAALDGIFDMIGPAFASFPFRTQVDGRLTTKSFLQNIEHHILSIIPHQSHGLQRIRQCGKGAASASKFECLVVVQPEDENLAGEGLWEEVHGQTSGLADSIPLSFELVLGKAKIMINCNADPAYLSHGDVSILLSQLDAVIKHLSTSAPEMLVSQVKLANKDEQMKFLDWARGYGAPVSACLHELFHESACRHTERIAIDDQNTRQFTYRELDDISSRLSTFLQARCRIGPETIIPVALEKSALAIITILAVLKAGGAYVPIDQSWPLERVQHILEETRAMVMLCSRDGSRVYAGVSKAVAIMEITEDCWMGEAHDEVGFEVDAAASSSQRPRYVPDASTLAFVMYTSGSTGVPKGVMLEHGALGTSLTHLTRVFALQPGTRHLQFSSFVYDVSVADIFIPLFSGACICVPTPENRLNRLSLTMKEMAIESAILTPSIVDLISPDDAFALKTIMTGGEMTKRHLIRKWAPKVRLLNAYGPTEASITTTLTNPLSRDSDPSNIGLNVTAWHWILRRHRNGTLYPAPMGCSGEIAIVGHSLARAYLNNPELTQKHFIKAPHLAAGLIPPRVYLTGDVGRYDIDGSIRILGRKDRMIKVNGVRVEPGESEQQLRQQGGSFSSCVVQCVNDEQSNAKIAAFVEIDPSEQTSLLGQGLIATKDCTPAFQKMCYNAQRRLELSLPRHYIPTLFVPIIKMPYTASDKADLKRLRDDLQKIPDISLAFGVNKDLTSQVTGRSPTTTSEIALEAAYREIFGKKEQLHTAVDFFKQGGDSFAAIKLVSAARTHGLEISVQQVYRHPILEDLASVACSSSQTFNNFIAPIQGVPLVSDDIRLEISQHYHISPNEIEDIFPTSTFQEGLAAVAFGDRARREQQSETAYSSTMAFELADNTDIVRLKQAIEIVVSKNPIWRTMVVNSSQGSMQVVRRNYFASQNKDERQNLFCYWIQQDNRLLFRIHHILYDAWTMNQLVDDINHNYTHPRQTKPAGKSYRHFIKYLSSLSLDGASKFWATQLKDAPLTSFPQSPSLDHRAQATEFVTHETIVDLQIIKSTGISAATVLAAALAILLSAYLNTDDVCYGSTLSGRDEPDLEDIAGPTISTVPMRVRIHDHQTVGQLLKDCQESLLNMRQYQHYGLQNIARLPGDGPRNASRFRTLLVVQQFRKQFSKKLDEGPVRELVVKETRMYVNYALVVLAEVDASDGHVTLRVEYDPKCFQREQAKRFAQQLTQTMAQCTDPRKMLSELELATAADRLEILARTAEICPPSSRYIHHKFDDMVSQYPDSPAVESMSENTSNYQNLSYRQLDEHVTRLCRRIRDYSSVSIFGLCFQKTPLMVILMLAVWKAGRAFTTLDPSAPPARLRNILADMGSSVLVLTEASQIQIFSPSEFILLDSTLPIMGQQLVMHERGGNKSAPWSHEEASDIAYLFYTSGSSGAPKGVVISHSAIVTSLSDAASVMSLGRETRMLQYAAFTFDTSILEIFGTLISGGCLCMPSESQRRTGSIAEAISLFRATHLILTPTLAQFLEPENMPNLRTLMLVGEPPSRHLLQNWESKSPAVQVMNGYGPTEASVHSSTNRNLGGHDPHNIGRATACDLFITSPDDVNKLAAIGAVGELVICGNTLADGYLNKPDLTSKVFGVNPDWLPKRESVDTRFYRTGDLVQYAPDLSIIYLGRKDLQVKIYGQRLELSEIEHQIRQYANFFGCVVDVTSSKTLVAFIVVDSSQQSRFDGPLPPETLPQAAVDGLRIFLSSVLPPFMVPYIYVPVNSLPITTSGKVDRRSLLSSINSVIDSYRIGSRNFKRPCENPIQETLAQIWAEAIPIPRDQIGLDDTIVSLGGDSISVIRIASGARGQQLSLDLTQLHHHITLEAMAKLLARNELMDEVLHEPPLPFSLLGDADQDVCISTAAEKCHVPRSLIIDMYPCTAMQEALMISSAKSPGAFFNQEVFQLAPGTSLSKLASVLRIVLTRHEILRTRIILDDQYQSLQVVLNEALELSLLTKPNIEGYLQRDASATPGYGERLFRCAIISCGFQSYLVFSQHHAIFDGWSVDLLLTEIEREYSAKPTSNSPPRLFSSFIRHIIEVRRSSKAEQFWKQNLAGIGETRLPVIKELPIFEANNKYVDEVTLPTNLKHSLATLIEAAWGLLLARYTGTEDVWFGSVRSGRTVPLDGVDEMIGPAIVTIPRRLHPLRAQHVTQYLQNVNDTIMEAVPWEQFGRQEIGRIEDGRQQSSKYSSIIVVQMASEKSTAAESRIILPQMITKGHILRHDCLTIECQPQENGRLILSITYDDRAIATDDVSWISYHLARLLGELCLSPDEILEDIDMTGPRGIKQVQEWNSTPIEPYTRKVNDIFAERARKWLSLTAINASDALLTYKELDELSSKFASTLKLLGVSKGDAVPIYMTKSAAMVVAMLAILKVGAGYVPLGTDSPQERIRFLLGKLHAKLIICTQDLVSRLSNLNIESSTCDVEELMSNVAQRTRSSDEARKNPVLLQKAENSFGTDLAYIIFTSGSSGEPKGVLIEHTALATTILANGRYMGYCKGTRTLSFAAYTFDVNVMEIWLTLLHGGCLYIPSEDQRLGNLCKYINDNNISLAFLTPTVIRNLLQSPSRVPSLKTLRAGGEPLPQTLLQQWSSKVRLINSYGPTETCVDACRNAHVTADTEPNNIGYANGTHLWVVKPGNKSSLAPIGCAGELLISGPTLARGYLNDEEKTQTAFIDGSRFPWAINGENRFYATGDMVRQNSDGSINFIGRQDLQTKVNGFRLELEEVEYAVERCESITAAIVDKVSLQDKGSEALAAFFTTAATTAVGLQSKLLSQTEHIRSIIRDASANVSKALPPYMVPSFYLPIDHIPLTTSGKVDRKALQHIFYQCSREQIVSYRSGPVQKREVRTIIQQILRGLWSQALSLDPTQIGLDSQFVSLGGDSFSAIKLATMSREIGFNLTITAILKTPKFEDMVVLVEKSREAGRNGSVSSPEKIEQLITKEASSCWNSKTAAKIAAACGLDTEEIEEFYRCTPLQEALMAVTARVPEAYIAHERFQIPSGMDLKRFRAAWELVELSNPILRTRIGSISTENGVENMQVVCKSACAWIDLPKGEFSNTVISMGIASPLIRCQILESVGEGFVFEILKHHAVFDGFSAKLLWEDFGFAFEHLTSPLPRPRFRNYVEYLCSIPEVETARFWTQSLEGFRGEHFPAPPFQGYVPRTTSKSRLTIETPLKWDKSYQLTFGTVAQAAWAIILSMRNRSPASTREVCFAVTLSGRNIPLSGIEDMTGPTITTVPVRIKLDLGQSIVEFLQQIYEQVISMLSYGYYGMGRIQALSDSAHEACKTPTLMVIQPPQLQDETLPLGLLRLPDDGEGMVELFGLVLECTQSTAKDSISLSASYDTGLLEEEAVRCILHQLSNMITQLSSNSTSSSTIRSAVWSMADDLDFAQMLEWNNTPQASHSACLHELVEESAKRHPSHLAVDAHDGRMTYEELEIAANTLAAILRKQYHVKAGDLVPLRLEKSKFMIVAILGVLKAGAGYVPLDTEHPKSRVEYIIQQLEAKLILISPLQATSCEYPVRTLVVGSNILSKPLVSAPSQKVTPNDIAYVTYTSGSSGEPKGVVTEHGAASLSILEHGKRYHHDRHGSKTRALQFSSYTFDASVLDIFAIMASGGCVCIPSEQQRLNNLEEVMRIMKINFADLTPTVANFLEPSRLPMLTRLAIGGEMANRSLIKKWCAREPPLDLFVNSYGPTEVAISCAVGMVSLEKPVGHVGKRVGGSLWIVDEGNHNQLMPISCAGELVVSGHTLARGYLNDNEKTRAAFIRNVPWLSRIGEKALYKTGDLARFDVDGNVEILGRKEDGQIKLHGMRLELGEIESAIENYHCLSAAPNIAAAKVNMGGNETLVAFINLQGILKTLSGSILAAPSAEFGMLATKAEDALRSQLPEYMIPRLWIPVYSWPLNASGKTDRKQLVSACETLSAAAIIEYQRSLASLDNSSDAGEKTETEKIIETAWKRVLKKDETVVFSPHDDFFKLGGDSLSTIMLIPTLRALEIHITAQEIFKTKTLRNMANLADSKNIDNSNSGYSAVSGFRQRSDDKSWSRALSTTAEQFSLISEPDGDETPDSKKVLSILTDQESIEEVYPASHTQLSFLIEGQKWCRSYYAWSFIDVGISTPITGIQEACIALTQHHPILRTSFHLINHHCYQAVKRHALDFKVLCFNASPGDMCAQLDKDIQHPVSFGQILTRFRLMINSETGRMILALGLSHAQYDGFSLPSILNDLGLAYTKSLPPVQSSPSYQQFIHHTLQICNDKTDIFWRETLKGSSMTSIVAPTTPNARPVMSKSIKRNIPCTFKHHDTVSYPVMLKAAWALALSRFSQTTDIIFGHLVSGRFAAFEGAHDLVGPCLNIIPARVRLLGPHQTLRHLLKDVHEAQVAAIPFESTPFDRIAAQTSWPLGTRFESIFQFQNIPDADEKVFGNVGDWKLSGNAVYGRGLLQSGACWLMAWPQVDGAARFRLTYCEETMSTEKAEAVLEFLFEILGVINADLDGSVGSVLELPVRYEEEDQHKPSTRAPLPSPSSSISTTSTARATILAHLISIWRSVLHPHLDSPTKIDNHIHIMPQDSFFELGGDSISAAEVAALCAKQGLRETIGMQDIIDFPTLEEQARLLMGDPELRGRSRRSKADREAITGLWFEEDWRFN